MCRLPSERASTASIAGNVLMSIRAPGTCDPVFNEAHEVCPTGDESYVTIGGVCRNCALRIGGSHESERVHDHVSFATALMAATMFG